MEDKNTDSAYTHQLPPITPDERDAVYAETQEAIKSRDMRKAHHLMLKMIQVDGGNPELWLLLAWTAPNHREAAVFFEHLLQVQPDYPLAICGVAWSGVEWAADEGTQASVGQVDEPVHATVSSENEMLGRQEGKEEAPGLPLENHPLSRKPDDSKPLEAIKDKKSNQAKKGGKPDKVNPAKPTRNQQAEWLQPAAWSLETATDESPFYNDAATGASTVGKLFLEGIGRIGFAVFLVLFLLGIISAELVTAYRNHIFGQAYYGALLILILLFVMFSKGSKNHKLLLTLSLVPLIRLVSLTIPQLKIGLNMGYIVIGIVMLIAALVVYHLGGFKPGQIGLVLGKYLPLQLLVGLSGVGLGFIEYLILKPESLVSPLSLPAIIITALLLIIFPGFLEEVIFRGLMQRASTGIFKRFGLLFISLLFALLHIGYRSWVGLIFLFLTGLLFSLIVEKTRSLMGVSLAHGLANISSFLIFPILLAAPVKNSQFLPSPLAQFNGPAIWAVPIDLSSPQEEVVVPGATNTPTPMPAISETATSVHIPISTESITATITSTASPTPTPSSSPSWSSTPTRTGTLIPTTWYTRTPTPTTTRTPTATPIPYITYTPSPTSTKTPYLSPTPTATTAIPTDELPTEAPTYTPTNTVQPTDVLPTEAVQPP